MRVAKTKEFQTLVNKYGLILETVSDSIVKYLLEDDDFEKDGRKRFDSVQRLYRAPVHLTIPMVEV